MVESRINSAYVSLPTNSSSLLENPGSTIQRVIQKRGKTAPQADPGADLFEKFFRQNYTTFIGSAMNVTKGDVNSAEDIVQEAARRVFNASHRGVDTEKLTDPYFDVSIKGVVKDEWRRRSVRPAELSNTDVILLFSPDTSADMSMDAADREEKLVAVREALNEIPQEQAQVVQMHYFEEKSTFDIAKELHWNRNTVKSRLMRGREAIQRTLGLATE